MSMIVRTIFCFVMFLIGNIGSGTSYAIETTGTISPALEKMMGEAEEAKTLLKQVGLIIRHENGQLIFRCASDSCELAIAVIPVTEKQPEQYISAHRQEERGSFRIPFPPDRSIVVVGIPVKSGLKPILVFPFGHHRDDE